MVKRRGSKKVKKGTLKRWVFVFVFIFLFLFGVKIALSYRKSIWTGGRFNFVFASEPVLVLSLSEKDKSLIAILIPQNTFVEVTRGYGLYRAETVYPLGELEGKGGQLLAETMQEFLGVPIKGWIKVSSKFKVRFSTRQAGGEKTSDVVALSSKLDKEEFIDLKRKLTSWGIFLKPGELIEFLREDLKTNLTLWDLAKIWLRAKKVSASKINFINLDKAGVLEEFSLPDGGTGKKGNPSLLDNLLKDFFIEPKIRKEKISIEVLNGTDSPGLAEKAARIITNIGGKVVKVGDSNQRLCQCQIKGGEKVLKSFSFLKMRKIFGCQILREEQDGLSLTVGKDYQQKLFSKE